MNLFSMFGRTNKELEKYKTALQTSEAENKKQFKSICELQSKLRTSESSNMRLEALIKKLDKWTNILANGEKETIIQEDKK